MSSSVSVRDIRQLRQTADFLENIADLHRAALIEQLGLKRYIYNALGKAAHQSANGAQLVWSKGTETVRGNSVKLGEHLYAIAQNEHLLPQAVVVDGKKYYL